MRLNRLAAMGSPVTCSCIDLVRPCRAAGRRWKARPIMSSASPCVADWIAGRLESRASASSLTDRQCIVLSSGRLACFAGPWVCLKEAPQPSSHVASLLLPSRSPPSPTALFTHGAFTDTFTLPRHITYRAPIQDASAAAFLSAHPPEHTTPLPTATGFISAISTSTATPASSLCRTAPHRNTPTLQP